MTESNGEKYTIYKITCLVNGRVYIGATSKTVEERFKDHWADHQCSKCKHKLIYRDMSTFGKDAFVIETIESGLVPEEAALRETHWINKLSDDGYLVYNEKAGGGRIKLTEEQERKIVQLYKEGLGLSKIAKIMNRSQKAIRNALNRNEIDTRDVEPSKAVLCIESGIVYESVNEAARQLGTDHRNISACCNGECKSTNGLHLCFEKDRDSFVVQEPKSHPASKEVFCIETGVVYPSAHEAARQLGLYTANISACCRRKLKSTGGMHFCFEEDKDSFVIQEPKTDSTSKKVLCVETGIIYPSAHEAARQLGLNFRNISACCLERRKSTGGYRFRYVD